MAIAERFAKGLWIKLAVLKVILERSKKDSFNDDLYCPKHYSCTCFFFFYIFLFISSLTFLRYHLYHDFKYLNSRDAYEDCKLQNV